ncbi:MAG: protein kinase [Streptosporangiaceae bacterium]|nr:protein kinase [Streptosporangiaceae bacterium]
MAEIISGGEPVNDSERAVIRHLRENGPADWVVLHNFELRLQHNRKYEIDVLVITGTAVTLIDVKGTHGRTEVAGGRWYPSNRQPFRSPVEKLRAHARALKGNLSSRGLGRVWVDALVVLTAPDARLIDSSDGPDADALSVVTGLADLIPELGRPERVRPSFLRDIRQHRNRIIAALTDTVQARTEPLRFGHWTVTESLGENEEVTEYRARNADAPASSSSALLRVYHADSLQPEDVRAAERFAISNAYAMLQRLPSHECVVGCLDFFSSEDESQYVLVLEDVSARALYLHLADPQRALATDAKLRVIRDMLRGLAHAHAYRVLHRALSPTTVLVTTAGGAELTGFDYARPEDPRSNSVLDRLARDLDPAYVAPECQNRPQAMSKASDVYAAGVIAYQVLTGELPFSSTTDQHQRASALPNGPMETAGLSQTLIDLLRRMCALSPTARTSAAEALDVLAEGDPSRSPRRPRSGTDYRNLPEGYQLTHKYTVLRKIGSGSFSAVYQVYDNLADTDWAVKIVDRDQESPVERLRQEYAILRALPPHPNVVAVENADYLYGGDVAYLVFEYLEGKDVSVLVKERVLGPADALRLSVDVADGLAFLHLNGVYHCDIKPSNLLWTERGCKIIDFNVAVLSESSLSRAGGSAKYAPPDRTRGTPPTADELVDRDVYALGVTLYQVLTGRYPFPSGAPTLGETATDPRSVPELRDLSDALVDALLRAVAPLRSDRYGSAAEFLAVLRAIDDVHSRPLPEPPAVPLPVPATPNVNPFVAHLQSLYSQSVVSNAGTRGEDAYGTYVPTAMDEHLIPDVLDGGYRLVIITGNAGDGKTAFLERLIKAAEERGGRRGASRANGTDVRLADGRWLRTNNDGSQDEGDRRNDDVLTEFFGPFADGAAADASETRLIAINAGRLVDFLEGHRAEFAGLETVVHAALAGEPGGGGIAIVNLNQRSLVAGGDKGGVPVFDHVLGQLTQDRLWAACQGCDLARECYAPHNAATFAHPSVGPKVTRRMRDLLRLVHLRGQLHITLRDLRSALAFMLTSGRDCAQIHQLYHKGDATQILTSFYFNSWLGSAETADRLLRLMRELDVAAVPDPALDRRLAALGPAADHGMMTIDQRGDYDLRLLTAAFEQAQRAEDTARGEEGPTVAYLASARRRFYFECVDDDRARSALPFRSAERFLGWLARPAELEARISDLVAAINRGEGLPDQALADGGLALAIRDVPGGTIRSYRLFPRESLSLAVAGTPASRYVEREPDGLDLLAHGPGGQVARLRIRLDLFELLEHQREGYLPSVADLQGRYVELLIFKNELSAAPYQEVMLTTGSGDAHRIRRERGGRLVMTGSVVTSSVTPGTDATPGIDGEEGTGDGA